MENQISPPLLHKHKPDDVLLMTPRRVLPSRFQSKATCESNDERVRALESLYTIRGQSFSFHVRSLTSNALGVPFETVMDESESDITRAIPHQVLDQILRQRCCSFDNDDIEAFLEHHGVEARSSSFQLMNRADHYFFYRKPHEHVPGIMFVEAARQTVYYQLYKFTDIKLGSVTISLNEQNAKYYSYGELMYPMEIVVDNLTEQDLRSPKKAHISTSFYQRGALIARIDSITPIIPLGRFEKARNAFLIGTGETFEPVDSSQVVALVISGSPENGRVEAVRLHDIGLSHCVTSGNSDEVRSARFSLIYAGKFFFQAHMVREESSESMGKGKTRWRFEKLPFAEIESLKEIIKRAFVFKETEKLEPVKNLAAVELVE